LFNSKLTYHTKKPIEIKLIVSSIYQQL
jgi:hypothetical protein